MKKEKNQDRSVTFRIKKELYQALTNKAIEASVKEGKIVKVSEVIRIALEKLVE
jgi:Arc/MetJ-type ribon-helix-helix transcriptional regulator